MSPRTKQQFDEIKEQTRNNIRAEALQLFAQNGYHGTTISQIAKAADISKGLMYNYYNSKEDLLRDIVMEAVKEGEQMIDYVLAESMAPLEKLKKIVDASFEMVMHDLKYWRLLTSLGLQTSVLKRLKVELRQKAKNALTLTEKLFIEMGIDQPKREAYILGALMDGVFLHYVSMTDLEMDYPIDDMKEFIMSRYQN